MNYSEFYNTLKKKDYEKVEFTNEHGERYFLIKTKGAPEAYFITGDECDWEMIPLFHPSFDVWSSEEITLLGQALQKIPSNWQKAVV